MLGVLNDTCVWQKYIGSNAYNEDEYLEPTTLPCAKFHETKLKQTDVGLISFDEKYYVFHTNDVGDRDLVDGREVVIEVVRSLSGEVLYYRAVVQSA